MVLLTEETILDQLKEYNINLLHFPPDETEHAFDIKNFKFFEDLGRGSFGVVKKGIFEPIGKVLAAKFVPFYQNRHEDNEEKFADQKKQFILHKEISEPKHKNIIDIYGYSYMDNTFIIFMESMDYSLLEFYQMVKNSEKQFPENLIGCIAVAVINGLVHCAEKQIIHRDLKPGNILINYHQGSIKLCDFGVSRIMVKDVASTYVGTIAYWPPERFDPTLVINEEGKAIRPIYDIRADIWSLGITLAEVVKGQLPYEFKNDGGLDLKEDRMALHKIITEVTSEEILESCFKDREEYTQELRIFLQACLSKIELRPKYDELMGMAFYQEYRIFNESKISLFIVNTIPENEINHLKELVKKNNLARMTKDISTNAYPTTTNFENSELIDEGIVASGDPVDNCFKAIFGREEFDDTISLAPPPYSKIPLETKNSLDKGKLVIIPVSYDSGISDPFGSFKNEAIASEIDKNEAEMALAKVKIDLAKEKIKLTEAERKEIKRQKTNSLVSKNSGETVTNFHVALDLANLVQGSISSNNASPISEITASNFKEDEKLISEQEQFSTSTLNTTTHMYKNWPCEQENLENTGEKDVEQINDLQQQENIYIPPFPVLPDLSSPQKIPIDSINPNRNYESVAPGISEPNLMKNGLEALHLKYPIALTNATPLEKVQPLNLTNTQNSSAKDTFHSSSTASINPLQASLDSNNTNLLQPPTYLETIGKIKQSQQTLKENNTKRNLEEIHTEPKSKNTSNKKRHIVEVIQEQQIDIKQRQKNPESFQNQSRKANEKNKQRKLEGSENPRKESQNTKSIHMQKENLASYTAIQIDSKVEPAVVQEDQSSNSTSVSIQTIEEQMKNENYNIDQPRNPILPQEKIDTPELIQSPVRETQVLTNKAASKEYELQHENIEDVSLLPIPIPTAGSNLETFILLQNETIGKLFQEIQTHHKAQTDFHKIQTELAILQKEKMSMELENLKNQKCHTIEIDHTDEHKTVQNSTPVEPTCLYGLKQRSAVILLIIIGIICFFSLVAILVLLIFHQPNQTYVYVTNSPQQGTPQNTPPPAGSTTGSWLSGSIGTAVTFPPPSTSRATLLELWLDNNDTIVSQSTTQSLTTSQAIDHNPPSTPICRELFIQYIRCTNFNSPTNNCNGSNNLLQYWAAKLTFEPGPNASTNFSLQPQTLEALNSTYAFKINVVFSSVRMDTDNNQDKYICPTNGSTCQTNLPYRSYIYVNITDAKGMNSYDTYEILFFNGQALIFGSQGDFFNPNQVYFSSTISKSYTGVIYECSRQEIIGEPEFYPSETCSNFDAEIRFFDKNDVMIVDVDLSISTNFDLSNPEIDYRSITVNQANLLLDPTGSATLYINEAADPCYYLNTTTGPRQCEQNQSYSYILNVDLTFDSNLINADLYTSTALALYKYWHVYYKPDGTPFIETDRCSVRTVEVLDWWDHLNGHAYTGAYANTTVCCKNFQTLPFITTTTGPTTAAQNISTNPPTTTSQPIDWNPPSTPICKELFLRYIKCLNFNNTTNNCDGNNNLLEYWAAKLSFRPGPDASTTFTLEPQTLEPISLNFTYNFMVNVIFSASDINFNLAQYSCTMYDNPCQVTVPYLSKIYVKITDASGTQVHEQQEIIFFNGQALFAGSEGDYLNPNLTYLTSHSSSNSYTGVIYACSSQMNVIQPDIYPIETCSNLNVTMKMFDKNDDMLAEVAFEILNTFDLSNPELDHRSVIVGVTNLLIDPRADATLYSNLVDACYHLNTSSGPMQCDQNQPTSYFLNLDFSLFSNIKNTNLHTSSAIALYKYWHVYYKPDGSPFITTDQCFKRTVDVLDYLGDANGYAYNGAYVNSTICCNEFKALPFVATRTTPTTTTTQYINYNPPSTQICNELSITYIKCDDTAVKYNGTTIVCDNNNAPLQYWAAKLAFEPGPDASTNFTLVPITLGPVYQNFTNNFIVTILFSSVNLDTDNYRDEFVCPNNVSTCQVNAPYRSNIYLNITDSTGMKSYDQQEISFFNGQALLARSEGDYLDPNEVYLSSFISSNTFVGVLYECSKKETIKQPEYYPTETCSNFEADIRFFDKDDNMLADFAMKIYTTFDLTNPVVDNRNISVDVVNILMDPEADPTLYTNIGDACYHLNTSSGAWPCDQNQPTSYFLTVDLSFFSVAKNAYLYTSTSIALYKYWHVYYKPDGTPFIRENQCFERTVEVHDYEDHLNGHAYDGAYANTTICCNEFKTLPFAQITTNTPTGEKSTIQITTATISTPTTATTTSTSFTKSSFSTAYTNATTIASKKTTETIVELSTTKIESSIETTAITSHSRGPTKSAMKFRSSFVIIFLHWLCFIVVFVRI